MSVVFAGLGGVSRVGRPLRLYAHFYPARRSDSHKGATRVHGRSAFSPLPARRTRQQASRGNSHRRYLDMRTTFPLFRELDPPHPDLVRGHSGGAPGLRGFPSGRIAECMVQCRHEAVQIAGGLVTCARCACQFIWFAEGAL